MAEPPWPPPYDHAREDPEPRPKWEDEGPDWLAFFALTFGLACVMVAIYLLLSTH